MYRLVNNPTSATNVNQQVLDTLIGIEFNYTTHQGNDRVTIVRTLVGYDNLNDAPGRTPTTFSPFLLSIDQNEHEAPRTSTTPRSWVVDGTASDSGRAVIVAASDLVQTTLNYVTHNQFEAFYSSEITSTGNNSFERALTTPRGDRVVIPNTLGIPVLRTQLEYETFALTGLEDGVLILVPTGQSFPLAAPVPPVINRLMTAAGNGVNIGDFFTSSRAASGNGGTGTPRTAFTIYDSSTSNFNRVSLQDLRFNDNGTLRALAGGDEIHVRTGTVTNIANPVVFRCIAQNVGLPLGVGNAQVFTATERALAGEVDTTLFEYRVGSTGNASLPTTGIVRVTPSSERGFYQIPGAPLFPAAGSLARITSLELHANAPTAGSQTLDQGIWEYNLAADVWTKVLE